MRITMFGVNIQWQQMELTLVHANNNDVVVLHIKMVLQQQIGVVDLQQQQVVCAVLCAPLHKLVHNYVDTLFAMYVSHPLVHPLAPFVAPRYFSITFSLIPN